MPARPLVTFEDPNCTYCTRLAPELGKLTDITIYTLPVAILGADSTIKAKSVLCAADPSRSWAMAMAGTLTEYGFDSKCKVAPLVDRNTAQFTALGFAGTPGLIFADGSRIKGMVSAESIERRLQAAAAAAAAASTGTTSAKATPR